ncbi:MAG: cysteine--tRNA ligase [Candidatus Saccharimonadales bacterium]
MTLKLHNTLTKQLDDFTPQLGREVSLYTCGPTVYNYLHVGNWSAYIYWDILVRVLTANDYDVTRVMNITDVGHLVSDADDGEDKLEKGARREGKTAWQIAQIYTADFIDGMEKLNLTTPQFITKATEYIPQQLDLVRTLKQRGFTYQIDDGIYFDTSKFPTYVEFAGLDLDAQRAGARVTFNDQKRNPSDFALWKFTPTGEKRDMQWETPNDLLDTTSNDSVGAFTDALQSEGELTSGPNSAQERSSVSESTERVSDHTDAKMGFPGWHLECSAMSMSILGNTIDIHTGGIDHIPVHHTNEIAQSEAASGQLFSRFWLHNNHLKVDGTKISKSLGNGYTLQQLGERGFSPMDYRMFVLQSHYSHEGNFTFDNLTAAKNRLRNWRSAAALRHQIHDTLQNDTLHAHDDKFVSLLATSGAILEAMNDDLNTPAALSIIDEAFGRLQAATPDTIYRHGLIHALESIDELLGLNLIGSTPDIDDDAKQLILQRERARDAKDWGTSDQLRDQLLRRAIVVRDTNDGSVWEYADN